MASATSLEPIEIEDGKIVLTIKKLVTLSYLDNINDVHVLHLNMDVDTKYWYDDIHKYLKNKIVLYHYDRNDKVRLKRSAIKFLLIGEILY